MKSNTPDVDSLIQDIASYAINPLAPSPLALDTAAWVLLDSFACALMAWSDNHCRRLIQPVVPGATLEKGSRVIGSKLELDPVQAAFCNGTLIRWLDYNDTWLAAEWGHPSDNLGAILALTDYRTQLGHSNITASDLLTTLIKAHEIQGVLALTNSLNAVGLDHVAWVKVASTAVSCSLLNLSYDACCSALTHAFLDGHPLRTYRQAPNTGPRKSWAAGDATSRAVRLALLAQAGEPGYPSVLTDNTWGFEKNLFNGEHIALSQPLNCYVMENILFKIAYPAEFHGQTAIEAAIELHHSFRDRLPDIERIDIQTQASACRIIDKTGPLTNRADRDHCLQYMVAVALLKGTLSAEHYHSEFHQSHPELDRLRSCMHVKENNDFSNDYLDPNKRSIANAIQLTFKDGSQSPIVTQHYPIGHRERRDEGLKLLESKIDSALINSNHPLRCSDLLSLINDHKTKASELMSALMQTKPTHKDELNK